MYIIQQTKSPFTHTEVTLFRSENRSVTVISCENSCNVVPVFQRHSLWWGECHDAGALEDARVLRQSRANSPDICSNESTPSAMRMCV